MQSSGLSQKFILPGPGSAVLAGLLVTQILSTVTVYLSNLQLQRKITAIHDAGYLSVPGLNTVPQLTSFSAAFWGGLFFTLTAGAALSLLACIAAWTYRGRNRVILAILLLIWFGLLYLVNANGLTLFASLFFLLPPPIVFSLGLKALRRDRPNRSRLLPLLPALPIVLLAVFWFTRMDARLFENIRDHLLLTNPAGKAINDFYYRYTLYPAEVFKPISHKTMRTCTLKGVKKPAIHKRLSAILRSHDYLAIEDGTLAELTVEKREGQIALLDNRRLIITAEESLFPVEAKTLLSEYSRRTDRFAFFRVFTFYGILIGFPILLYLSCYCLLRLVFGMFLAPAKASAIAAACCLAVGMAAWIPIYQAGRADIAKENLQEAISTGSRQQRIAALRHIEENALEVTDFPAYRQMLNSFHIQERYWLARALSAGRDRYSFSDLLSLLNDPHPNVVCQALYAIGKRGNRTVIPAVIQTIKTADSWYVQRYGYNTLRKLGWQQPAST